MSPLGLLPFPCVLYQQMPPGEPTIVRLLCRRGRRLGPLYAGLSYVFDGRCLCILRRQGGAQGTVGVQADSWQHLGHIGPSDVLSLFCSSFPLDFKLCGWWEQ